jgi:hypothetical protein
LPWVPRLTLPTLDAGALRPASSIDISGDHAVSLLALPPLRCDRNLLIDSKMVATLLVAFEHLRAFVKEQQLRNRVHEKQEDPKKLLNIYQFKTNL